MAAAYNKNEMVLINSDNGCDLVFRSVNGVLSNVLHSFSVENSSVGTLAFKLKRTLPAIIKISPGYGYISPQEKVTFQVKMVKADVTKMSDFEDSTTGRITVVTCPLADEENRPEKAKLLWKKSPPPATEKVSKNRMEVKFENIVENIVETVVENSVVNVDEETERQGNEPKSSTTSSHDSGTTSEKSSTTNEKSATGEKSSATSGSDSEENSDSSDESSSTSSAPDSLNEKSSSSSSSTTSGTTSSDESDCD